MDMDFEADLEINPDELDVAALEQANLAMKYSKEAAHYDKVAKKASEKVKTVRSELIMAVSQDPEGVLGKGAKPTVAVVEAYYRTHPEYVKAKDEMIEAEYQRDLVKAAADHISFQRKKSLELLVELLAFEYFSGPATPGNLTEKWNKRRKQVIENTMERVAPKLGSHKRSKAVSP